QVARQTPARFAGALAVFVLVTGCSTNPITGRDQILALPVIQAVHANVSFALAAGVQDNAGMPACKSNCGAGDPASFAGRVAAIGARIEAVARDVAPDVFRRVGKFQIGVNDSIGMRTGSSAR